MSEQIVLTLYVSYAIPTNKIFYRGTYIHSHTEHTLLRKGDYNDR